MLHTFFAVMAVFAVLLAAFAVQTSWRSFLAALIFILLHVKILFHNSSGTIRCSSYGSDLMRQHFQSFKAILCITVFLSSKIRLAKLKSWYNCIKKEKTRVQFNTKLLDFFLHVHTLSQRKLKVQSVFY